MVGNVIGVPDSETHGVAVVARTAVGGVLNGAMEVELFAGVVLLD